jgi:hypothetical protein
MKKSVIDYNYSQLSTNLLPMKETDEYFYFYLLHPNVVGKAKQQVS